LVGDLNCNISNDCIYVHTTDEKTYESIEKIAKRLEIGDSIKIEEPMKDYMRGGYKITIVRK